MNGMNHPLQQLLAQQMFGSMPQQAPSVQSRPMVSGVPQFVNPLQKMNYIMQAMRNPAQFVREHVSGIPESAFNDPTGNGVLNYMQQNMGVTNQDIVNAQNQIPQIRNSMF